MIPKKMYGPRKASFDSGLGQSIFGLGGLPYPKADFTEKLNLKTDRSEKKKKKYQMEYAPF